MIAPTRLRGFSDAYGSWNTICSSRRTGRSWRREYFEMSMPSKTSEPLVMSYSRAMHRARVDLPQPDSPTRPRVSPARSSKLTSSTACTRRDLALHEEARPDREVLLDVVGPQQDLAGGDLRACLQHRQVGRYVVGHGLSSTSSGWIVRSLTSAFCCGVR